MLEDLINASSEASLVATSGSALSATSAATLNEPTTGQYIIFLIAMIWVMVWKILALWRAARKNDKFWFIVIFVINTLGLLEIAYYFYLSRYDWSQIWTKLKLDTIAKRIRQFFSRD